MSRNLCFVAYRYNTKLCRSHSDFESIMAPDSSTSACSDHDRVFLDGKNTGAAMFVRQHPSAAVASCCCCCRVEVHVNNNIQGVTNSILFGSKVIMRDPGMRLSLTKVQRRKKKISAVKRTGSGKEIPAIGYRNFLMLFVLLVAYILFFVLMIVSS